MNAVAITPRALRGRRRRARTGAWNGASLPARSVHSRRDPCARATACGAGELGFADDSIAVGILPVHQLLDACGEILRRHFVGRTRGRDSPARSLPRGAPGSRTSSTAFGLDLVRLRPRERYLGHSPAGGAMVVACCRVLRSPSGAALKCCHGSGRWPACRGAVTPGTTGALACGDRRDAIDTGSAIRQRRGGGAIPVRHVHGSDG